MPSPSDPRKRLVLCLDGTWNSGFDEHKRRDGHTVLKPTNTLKTSRAVLPVAADGRLQLAYYDIGVGALAEYPGTSNRLLRFSDRVLGGAWGAGFEGNVEDALHFLALNFERDDDVYVFGFSRGAATARAVTQFLDWNGGLPQKRDAYYLPRLFRAYVNSHGAMWMAPQELANINADRAKEKTPKPPLDPFRPVRVKYLGVWDTVLALGSRFEASPDSTSVAARSFYTGSMPATCVVRARQALAVDEKRWDFRPEIWKGCLPHQTMQQRFFIGVHSNAGGGYGRDGLANIALDWILKGAREAELQFDEDYLKPFLQHLFAGASLYESKTLLYRVLDGIRAPKGAGTRRLVGLPAEANWSIDPSIINRMSLDPAALAVGAEPDAIITTYRPQNVIELLAAQPDLEAYLQKIGATAPLPADVIQQIEAIATR